MPFDINYGPISTAMGLARQAGQAQGTQLGFQDQQEMQRQLLAQQQASQQARAQDISLSLEGQRNAATQNLAQAQLANTTAYQHANLAQLGQYRQDLGNSRVQQAGAAQQRADQQGGYQQGQLQVQQQKLVQQQAYQQWEQQHGDFIASNGQAQQINSTIKNALAAGKNLTDPDIAPLVQHLTQLEQQTHMVNSAASQQGAPFGTPGGAQPPPPGYAAPSAGFQGSRGQLTDPQMAQHFLTQANGDPNMARQLAIQAGFTL